MQNEKRFAVSGYRDFHNYEFFKAEMDKILALEGRPRSVSQGEAPGVDQLCKRWCEENKIACLSFHADWSKGNRAGPLRNAKMLETADILIAFRHNASTGTVNAISIARKRNKKVYEIDISCEKSRN